LEYSQPLVIFSTTTPLALEDCIMKKILGFYAWVLVDVNLLSFVTDVDYEQLLPFCRHCPQSG